MDHWTLMEQRHSVRQYLAKPIEAEKRETLNRLISSLNEESGLHIQIFYEEPTCFHSLLSRYGKFTGVENYLALVGKKSPELEDRLGYYGEQIVLKAQELGLNTCWVALTHGKSKAELRPGEKQVCLIALGYVSSAGVPHKSKPLAVVSNYKEGMPDWFRKGVEAALLAPTAMNQQKFRFTLESSGQVRATSGSGFYTRLDLGIAKYHFELGAERTL